MKQGYWLILVALGILLMLAGCQLQRNQPLETPWGVLQPRVGGMVLPQERPAQPAVSEPGLPPDAPAMLQVGQEVVAVGVDLFRLYADAEPKAPVLNVYTAGDSFIVIEPSDAILAYPVVKDARTWYRVQAADGLVGWVLVDAIVPAGTE